MPIKNRLAETHAEITAWRRHLHQHPELLFDVHETAKFVEEKLRSFGITDITTGIGRTGVVAVIEGRANTSGRAIGLSAEMVAQAGAVLMIGFGANMLVPQLSERFAFATAGVSSSADASITSLASGGWRGQFTAGLLLGAVWSPCVGPTLGGAISMASQGENLLRAGGIMVAFAFGIGTVVIALGYGASAILRRNQTRMIKFAAAAKPALGAVFILVGTALLLQWHHRVESWLLDIMPYWLQDLSVAL